MAGTSAYVPTKQETRDHIRGSFASWLDRHAVNNRVGEYGFEDGQEVPLVASATALFNPTRTHSFAILNHFIDFARNMANAIKLKMERTGVGSGGGKKYNVKSRKDVPAGDRVNVTPTHDAKQPKAERGSTKNAIIPGRNGPTFGGTSS